MQAGGARDSSNYRSTLFSPAPLFPPIEKDQNDTFPKGVSNWCQQPLIVHVITNQFDSQINPTVSSSATIKKQPLKLQLNIMPEEPLPRPVGPEVDDHPAPWPGKPILKGKFARLEALSMSHLDDLYKCMGGKANAYLHDYIPSDPSYDIESFRKRLNEKVHHKEWIFLAIIDSKTNEASGYVILENINTQNRSVEVGVVFSTRMQRSPIGTESVYLLARYIFEDLGYRRFEWKADSLNAGSLRAAERLGFTYEGTFRQHMIVKGRNRDTVYYSMLDGEWPVIKEAFERWLREDNFDASGKQRSSLPDLRKGIVDSKSQ